MEGSDSKSHSQSDTKIGDFNRITPDFFSFGLRVFQGSTSKILIFLSMSNKDTKILALTPCAPILMFGLRYLWISFTSTWSVKSMLIIVSTISSGYCLHLPLNIFNVMYYASSNYSGIKYSKRKGQWFYLAGQQGAKWRREWSSWLGGLANLIRQ